MSCIQVFAHFYQAEEKQAGQDATFFVCVSVPPSCAQVGFLIWFTIWGCVPKSPGRLHFCLLSCKMLLNWHWRMFVIYPYSTFCHWRTCYDCFICCIISGNVFFERRWRCVYKDCRSSSLYQWSGFWSTCYKIFQTTKSKSWFALSWWCNSCQARAEDDRSTNWFKLKQCLWSCESSNSFSAHFLLCGYFAHDSGKLVILFVLFSGRSLIS